MSSLPPILIPSNRHLAIVPHFKKKEEESGFIMPDDYKRDIPKFIRATVLDTAPDCKGQFLKLQRGLFPDSRDILVDSSMIEEVEINNKKYHLILENYVVGILKG